MRDILHEWNPWWKSFSCNAIERNKLKEIIPWLNRREIISILGVRRAGKTTLMYELISYLLKSVNPNNILFIKADDDRVDKLGLIDRAIDEYFTLLNPKGKIYIFIDEVQEVDGWDKALKRIYDLNEYKIIISGSNASILKSELSSSLAGRFSYFELFPFSFDEFLKAKASNATKKEIRHYLSEYIEFGSFPEVILEERKNIKAELVKFYFDSIFYRDIIKRNSIRNPEKTEKLVKYYLQNISNLANFSSIGRALELTTDSITEYTRLLEEAYLIFSIKLFGFSYKKQIINPKKIYCVDTGIRNITGFSFSKDTGRLYENLVFLKLLEMKKEIYYWRNGVECDFIVKEKNKIEAIQVCYSPKEREEISLKKTMDEFKIKKGLVITDDYEKHGKIEYIPLWKWLLG